MSSKLDNPTNVWLPLSLTLLPVTVVVELMGEEDGRVNTDSVDKLASGAGIEEGMDV
jgi:hypothetical protein